MKQTRALCWSAVVCVAALAQTASAQTVGDVGRRATRCSTAGVERLSAQLAEAQRCLFPDAFMRFAPATNIRLESNRVHPYAQPSSVRAIQAAARDVPLTINSAFRTLADQYVLRTSRGCGVVASPGRSNHQAGRAIDVGNWSAARSALRAQGCRWYGSDDAVHFDCPGVDRRRDSIIAFQELWNANNPGDTITVDGDYGPATASRLDRSPAAGFPMDLCGGTRPPPMSMDAGMTPAPPSGPSGCFSSTLGRAVDHLDCVQVNRGACGADSCGTYQCMDGEWGCAGTCETVHRESESCGAPVVSPRPRPRPATCRSSTLGRNVNSGECVQTDGRRRPGAEASCANGCGFFRCDEGRWVCEPNVSACTATFDNAACGSAGEPCRSDTLGRQVESGSCVQVSRPACGESSCGWYRCGDGAWACTDLTSCDADRFPNAVCGDSDPCSAATECGACAEITGCGWCESAGECQSASAAAACADWVDDRNECVACDASDCESCAVSGFCSWCPGVGCVNDSDPDELAMCGEIVRTADRCE